MEERSGRYVVAVYIYGIFFNQFIHVWGNASYVFTVKFKNYFLHFQLIFLLNFYVKTDRWFGVKCILLQMFWPFYIKFHCFNRLVFFCSTSITPALKCCLSQKLLHFTQNLMTNKTRYRFNLKHVSLTRLCT